MDNDRVAKSLITSFDGGGTPSGEDTPKHAVNCASPCCQDITRRASEDVTVSVANCGDPCCDRRDADAVKLLGVINIKTDQLVSRKAN